MSGGGGGGGGGGGFTGGLYSCVSSTSSTTATPTTITSGIGSSSNADHTFTSSSSIRPYYYKHIITSRKSFNREIKNLLDIAENKTKLLCKVYDSSMNEESAAHAQGISLDSSSLNAAAAMVNNTSTALYASCLPPTEPSHRPTSYVRASSAAAGASKDRQKALLPKDYKKIIDMNYSNLRKKQSNVLNKVKLWDQLLESGSLNIASWGKNFFEFS